MAGRLTEELRRVTRAQSGLHPVDAGSAPRATGRGGASFGWLTLVVVIALVVGGWFLVRKLQADAAMQDCVMSGRKNCAPVDTSGANGTTTPP